MLRELNQERGHCCGKTSATGMPNVRCREGAVGDPEKHISYCTGSTNTRLRPGVPPASLQIPAEGYLKGQDQGASVSQECSDLCEGLDPCSQAVPGQSRQQL